MCTGLIVKSAEISGASSLGAPGCTPFSKSVIASNHDYSQLYNFLQFVSLNTTLASLTSTATLLTPDNAATAALRQGSNITYAEGENSTVLQHAMQLQVVPEALLVRVTPVMCCLLCVLISAILCVCAVCMQHAHE